jgi:predicted deacetylase
MAGGISARERHRKIAVALHDIEPATFERCALIRDWLSDLGIDRVTLLVIPARDLHPLQDRRPEMVDWLQECTRSGDAIAQHGFQHLQLRRGHWPRQMLARLQSAGEPEFVGLDIEETRRAVNAGWRVLKLAGVEPAGFVAPAYAYTPALRQTLVERFRWWADLLRLHSTRAAAELIVPAVGLATAGALRRAVSPSLLRAGTLLAGEVLRLDLHPADLSHPRHVLALEGVLRRSGARRQAITYDELLPGS